MTSRVKLLYFWLAPFLAVKTISCVISYLLKGALLSLAHDVRMGRGVKLGQLVQGYLDVSHVQAQLLVDLFLVAALLHVVHEEVVLVLLQFGIWAWWKIELNLSLKSQIGNKLFEIGNELGISSSLFLIHLCSAMKHFSIWSGRRKLPNPVVLLHHASDCCLEVDPSMENNWSFNLKIIWDILK